MTAGSVLVCPLRRLHQAVRAGRDHPPADRLPGRALHAAAEADDSAAGDRQSDHRSVPGDRSVPGHRSVPGLRPVIGHRLPATGQSQVCHGSLTTAHKSVRSHRPLTGHRSGHKLSQVVVEPQQASGQLHTQGRVTSLSQTTGHSRTSKML